MALPVEAMGAISGGHTVDLDAVTGREGAPVDRGRTEVEA